MRLLDFYETYYKPARLHGKTRNADRLYRVAFRNFGRTLGREPLVSDLTNTALRRHMQFLIDHGRAKATANRDRCSLVALWRYAARTKFVDSWPDVPKESEPVRVPQAWQREDIDKLLQAAANVQGYIKESRVPLRAWWTALLLLILDTGERIGAVRAAEWDWLDGKSILVPAEARKGGKRDKWFTLSDATIDALNELRRATTGKKIFHWPYFDTYLWTRYHKLLESAGLPTGRKCKFHRCRKTVASVAYQMGLDAQELLDHSSRKITQRYLDPRFTRETQASQIMAEWLRTPPAKKEKGVG